MERELKILSESLDQKLLLLQALLQDSKKQGELLCGENPDLEGFDQLVDRKDQIIDKISLLDDGFEAMYERLSKGLESNRSLYKEQITVLQKKIGLISDYSVRIQEQESKNKQLMDDYFLKRKNQIRSNRQNSKAAYDYYRNMNGSGGIRPSFLDNRQYRD